MRKALPRVTLLLWLAVAVPLCATTQIDFTLDDMIRFADVAAHVRIVDVVCHDEACDYTVVVESTLFGTAGRELRFTLLQHIEAMPQLRKGGEYVLFLNHANRVEKIIGLSRGTLTVEGGRLFDDHHRPIRLVDNRIRPVERAQVATNAAAPAPALDLATFTSTVRTRRDALRRAGIRLRGE